MQPNKYVELCCDIALREACNKFDQMSPLTRGIVEHRIAQGVLYQEIIDEHKYVALFMAAADVNEVEASRLANLFRQTGSLEWNLRRRWIVESRVNKMRTLALYLCGATYRTTLKDVPVGISWQPYLQGGAGAVPAGGNIVLLHIGIDALPKFAAWMLSDEQSDSEQSGDTSKIDRLRRWARHSLGTEYSSGGAQFQVQGHFDRRLTTAYTELMMIFLILHEYGHIVHGHTATSRRWEPDDRLSPEGRLQRRALQRQFEYEADRFAVDALRGIYIHNTTADMKRPQQEAALRMLFYFLAIGCEPFDESPDLLTHPPSLDRLKRIYRGDPYTEEEVERESEMMHEAIKSLASSEWHVVLDEPDWSSINSGDSMLARIGQRTISKQEAMFILPELAHIYRYMRGKGWKNGSEIAGDGEVTKAMLDEFECETVDQVRELYNQIAAVFGFTQLL